MDALLKYVREPNAFTLDFYLQHEGYDGLKKALAMKPDAVIELVKASGLRGRGGAGFPTGMKWQYVDKKSPNPKYIACNADESEPGTFKDHLLMERNPHLLIVLKGAEWFAQLGPEKNGGPKLFCISGHVKRPGVYEAPMTITLRALIDDRAGGVPDGRTLKAVIPGGSSVPVLMPDQLDTPA